MLLLLKEKLRRLSPPGTNDVLIREQFVPQFMADGTVRIVGSGKKTVDFGEIQRRFEALQLKVNWAHLKRLQLLRNEVEHHSPTQPAKVLQEALAMTLPLVTSVLVEHLGADPVSVFNATVWEMMLAEAETYREVEKQCRSSREAMAKIPDGAARALGDFLQCPDCESDLLKATSATFYEGTFVCQACGDPCEIADVLPKALQQQYSNAIYESIKDGGDSPIGRCPTCSEIAFFVEDDACLLCDEGRPYKTCLVCGESLSLDESDEPLCGYHRYVAAKDD